LFIDVGYLFAEGPDAATNTGAMSTAVACWRGRSNISVLITKAEANQMHQRLSFADESEPAAIAMEGESKSAEVNDLTGPGARNELIASSKSDQAVVNNADEEVHNGKVE